MNYQTLAKWSQTNEILAGMGTVLKSIAEGQKEIISVLKNTENN
jgi:hypothetical protein